MRRLLALALIFVLSVSAQDFHFRVFHNLRVSSTSNAAPFTLVLNSEVIDNAISYGMVTPDQSSSRYWTRTLTSGQANFTVYETANSSNIYWDYPFVVSSEQYYTVSLQRVGGDTFPPSGVFFQDNMTNTDAGFARARFINVDGTNIAMTFSINGTTTIDSTVGSGGTATGNYIIVPATAEDQFVVSISAQQTRSRRNSVPNPTTQVGETVVTYYPPFGYASLADGSVTTFYVLGGAPNNTMLALSDKPSNDVEVTIIGGTPPPTTAAPTTAVTATPTASPGPSATQAATNPVVTGTTAPPPTSQPTTSPAPSSRPAQSAEFQFSMSQCLQPNSADLTAIYSSFANSAGVPVTDIQILARDSACPSLSRQAGNYDYLCKVDDPSGDALSKAQQIVNDINSNTLAGAPSTLVSGSATTPQPSSASLPAIALTMLVACVLLLTLSL